MQHRFYITRHLKTEPMREIWCAKRKVWQWFYSSDNTAYTSIGRAQRVVDQLERDGVIRFNEVNKNGITVHDNVEIIRTDIFVSNRRDRVY
jgi:hypothetical protein